MIYDITNDIFHLDYLMAVITAVFWIRCIILLRLSQTFGPLLVMIYRMFVLVGIFLCIYVLGMLTFSCVAALTLTEKQEFSSLFEATRTYFAASLGEFDLNMFDDLDGWKKYYGIGLHLVVLFSNMVLMINLLIAIMSDTYVALTEV